MVKTYECIGIFPLEFTDGQQVEAGETFSRDFEKTSGVQHELWLIQVGHIIEKVPAKQVTKTPSGPSPVKGDKE